MTGWRMAAGVLCGLLLVSTGSARAEVHRLGVAPSGELFPAALRTSLAPWNVKVVAVDVSPRNLGQAAELARARAVDALVWIDGTGGSHTLWVYDAGSDKLLGKRVVVAPPFDEPTAAAVSLSVKTLLRHSQVAPERERFGAGPELQPPPEREPRIFLAVGPGLRFFDDGGITADSRLTLELAWYPSASWLGVVGIIDVGADRSVKADGFVGQFRDNALALAVRGQRRITDRLVVHLQTALVLRRTSLDGLVVSEQLVADDQRLNPAIDGELGTRIRVLAGLYLQLGASLQLTVRRQRYTVFQQPVVSVPQVSASFRAALAIPFM